MITTAVVAPRYSQNECDQGGQRHGNFSWSAVQVSSAWRSRVIHSRTCCRVAPAKRSARRTGAQTEESLAFGVHEPPLTVSRDVGQHPLQIAQVAADVLLLPFGLPGVRFVPVESGPHPGHQITHALTRREGCVALRSPFDNYGAKGKLAPFLASLPWPSPLSDHFTEGYFPELIGV